MCGVVACAGSGGVSGHKAKDSSVLEGKGWKKRSHLVLLGVACVTPYPPSGDCWTCKAGAASLSKLTFSFSNTFCQRETLRKLAWDHTGPPGAHPDPCLWVQSPFPAYFGLWIKGKISQCCSPLCQPALVFSSKPTWLSASCAWWHRSKPCFWAPISERELL